jgi:hypothetical protein
VHSRVNAVPLRDARDLLLVANHENPKALGDLGYAVETHPKSKPNTRAPKPARLAAIMRGARKARAALGRSEPVSFELHSMSRSRLAAISSCLRLFLQVVLISHIAHAKFVHHRHEQLVCHGV